MFFPRGGSSSYLWRPTASHHHPACILLVPFPPEHWVVELAASRGLLAGWFGECVLAGLYQEVLVGLCQGGAGWLVLGLCWLVAVGVWLSGWVWGHAGTLVLWLLVG